MSPRLIESIEVPPPYTGVTTRAGVAGYRTEVVAVEVVGDKTLLLTIGDREARLTMGQDAVDHLVTLLSDAAEAASTQEAAA